MDAQLQSNDFVTERYNELTNDPKFNNMMKNYTILNKTLKDIASFNTEINRIRIDGDMPQDLKLRQIDHYNLQKRDLVFQIWKMTNGVLYTAKEEK